RLDRRQMGADPDSHADRGDYHPEAADCAPIESSNDQGTQASAAASATARAALALGFGLGARSGLLVAGRRFAAARRRRLISGRLAGGGRDKDGFPPLLALRRSHSCHANVPSDPVPWSAFAG